MKNLILQIWEGEPNELASLSSENHKRYAERIGADYKLLTDGPFFPGLTVLSQKVHFLSECFDEYDWVFMSDSDNFLVKECSESIFDQEGYGGEHPMAFRRVRGKIPALTSIGHPYWGGSIYKMPREMRRNMRSKINKKEMRIIDKTKGAGEDEGIMHRLATLADIPVEGAYLEKGIPPEKQKWCHQSHFPNVENACLTHVRNKLVKGRMPKIEAYRILNKRGIIT